MYDATALNLYRHFVEERHAIYLARRAGRPQPWTGDTVLASRKFTNVFRVLDPGSQFVLTDLWTKSPSDFITRCVFYRLTNLPATWYALREMTGGYPTLADFIDGDLLIERLMAYREAGNRVFSGAYIIVPEPGTPNDKVGGAVRVTKNFALNFRYDFLQAETQVQRFSVLKSVPGIGTFLAMQILTDWGYAQRVNRENDFVMAGPGARRGAAHLTKSLSPEEVIYDLTAKWRDRGKIRLGHSSLSQMDVQNTLCEFSKYHRFAVQGKPYRQSPYRPAHPGRQPAPVLPKWMR